MLTAEELYIDQAPYHHETKDQRTFTAIHLRSALTRMHLEFVERLGKAKTPEALRGIERDIRNNPHLHPDIINNLLRNVQDQWEQS